MATSRCHGPGKIWRHQQNRKYITYDAAREVRTTVTGNMHRKSGEVRACAVWFWDMHADRQTDRQTDTLIAILRWRFVSVRRLMKFGGGHCSPMEATDQAVSLTRFRLSVCRNQFIMSRPQLHSPSPPACTAQQTQQIAELLTLYVLSHWIQSVAFALSRSGARYGQTFFRCISN